MVFGSGETNHCWPYEKELHKKLSLYEKEMTRLAEVLERISGQQSLRPNGDWKDTLGAIDAKEALAEHKDFKEKMK